MPWAPHFGPNLHFPLCSLSRPASNFTPCLWWWWTGVPKLLDFMPRGPQAISTAIFCQKISLSFETQLKHLQLCEATSDDAPPPSPQGRINTPLFFSFLLQDHSPMMTFNTLQIRECANTWLPLSKFPEGKDGIYSSVSPDLISTVSIW